MLGDEDNEDKVDERSERYREGRKMLDVLLCESNSTRGECMGAVEEGERMRFSVRMGPYLGMHNLEIQIWLSEKVKSVRKEFENVPDCGITRREVSGMKINLRSFGERDEDGKERRDRQKGGRSGRRW